MSKELGIVLSFCIIVALCWVSVDFSQSYGAVSDTRLVRAVMKTDALVNVQALLLEGAEVNARDDMGMTALMWASYKGKSGCVKLLVEKGADISLKNKDGSSAIDIASARKNDTIKIFLQKSLP
jgi:ankyrin repeat protein